MVGDCSPATTQLLVASRTPEIEVSDSHFFVAWVNNVMLSNKVSQYTLCCRYCARGLRCYQQTKSVLLLSEVNGSAVVPRCTIITAHCTDFLSSDPAFYWPQKTCSLLIAQCRWMDPMPSNCCTHLRGISRVNYYFPFYSYSTLTCQLFHFHNKNAVS